MAEFNSFIFKPSERKNQLEERKNLIGGITFLLIILFFVLEIYWIMISLTIILFGTCYLVAFDRWNRLEQLNGSFPLSLTISRGEIRVGNKAFPMNEVRINKLTYFDYKGRSTTGYIFFVRYVKRSNGTWNHLWFNHQQSEYQLRFRVDNQHHLKQLEELKNQLSV